MLEQKTRWVPMPVDPPERKSHSILPSGRQLPSLCSNNAPSFRSQDTAMNSPPPCLAGAAGGRSGATCHCRIRPAAWPIEADHCRPLIATDIRPAENSSGGREFGRWQRRSRMALFLDIADNQKHDLLSALGLLHVLQRNGDAATLDQWLQCARVHCLSKVSDGDSIRCARSTHACQPHCRRRCRLPPDAVAATSVRVPAA